MKLKIVMIVSRKNLYVIIQKANGSETRWVHSTTALAAEQSKMVRTAYVMEDQIPVIFTGNGNRTNAIYRDSTLTGFLIL